MGVLASLMLLAWAVFSLACGGGEGDRFALVKGFAKALADSIGSVSSGD